MERAGKIKRDKEKEDAKNRTRPTEGSMRFMEKYTGASAETRKDESPKKRAKAKKASSDTMAKQVRGRA